MGWVEDYLYGSYGVRPKTYGHLIDLLKKELGFARSTKLGEFAEDVAVTAGEELARAPSIAIERMRKYSRDPVTDELTEYAKSKLMGIKAAEKSGEVVQERGGSSYKAAEYVPDSIARPSFDQIPVGGRKPTEAPSDGFSDTDFGSLMRRYVADELRYPEEEAARRASSVQISVPGREIPYDVGPGSYYSEPWLQAQKIVEQAGGKPGGGTLSVMGGNLAGGDTTESLRRYADEFKRNQTAIKIATIEASAPAKYRSPATNQYLDMLYKQKADEERAEVDAMQAAAAIRNADANVTQSEAYAQYYGGRNAAETEQESIKALADIEIEKIKTKGDLMVQFKDLLATLGGDPVKGGNPQLYVQVLKAIGMAPTPQQAYEDVLKLIGGTGLTTGAAGLEEADKNLFMTP